MVRRDRGDPDSLIEDREAGPFGGSAAGSGAALARWTFLAAARDALAGCELAARRLALVAGRLALRALTLDCRFDGRLEELTPELPDLAD
jgi:hypothetical protein